MLDHPGFLFVLFIICIVYLQKGTCAPKAAGRIHTDFEKGFIMAEVMKVDDLMELGDDAKVCQIGKCWVY